MAANENTVVDDGTPIAPPRNPPRNPPHNGGVPSGVPTRAGSSPFHSIGNNGVTLSDERLKILNSRLADSSKAKRSNIASLERAFFAMKVAVDKANDREDEATEIFIQQVLGRTL